MYLNTMARNGYSGISIPNPLINKIDEVVDEGNYGYSGRADFVKDAVRRLLHKLQQNGNGGSTQSSQGNLAQKQNIGETKNV